jgi:serine/threonine-protein kinase
VDGEWIVPGYRHVRTLGEGASGRVVQGEHLATGTPVAIKYLSPQLADDEEFLARFRDEAHLLGDIRDPHLVLFHEYVEGPRGAAIVMELVDGVSLSQLLNSEGATQPEAALAVLKGSLLGLTALHQAGVVHRDYKPGNVLISADGYSKLADVGIAVRAGDNVPSAGTPAYMPPEQWGGRPVTPATDVYAATAVFYECLTGERPYPERTLPQLALAHRTAAVPVDRVPPPLQPLVLHGLAKDPYDRPLTAEMFLNELEAEALAEYGDDWEERGRSQLKERAALLALLFPIHRPTEAGATGIGLSELGEGMGVGKKTRRLGLVAALGLLAVILLGGGGAIVLAANSSSTSALAKKTHSPAALPGGDPSADPSGDPSQPPTDSASPSATPAHSATPSPTPAPGTSAPAPNNPAPATTAPATTAPATTAPAPTPTTTKPKPKPTPTKTTPKPVPFQVTGVNVSLNRPTGSKSGTFTVTVSTKGTPAEPVTVAIVLSRGMTAPTSVTVTEASSFSGTYTVDGACIGAPYNWTIKATTPEGFSSSDTTTGPDYPEVTACG